MDEREDIIIRDPEECISELKKVERTVAEFYENITLFNHQVIELTNLGKNIDGLKDVTASLESILNEADTLTKDITRRVEAYVETIRELENVDIAL